MENITQDLKDDYLGEIVEIYKEKENIIYKNIAAMSGEDRRYFQENPQEFINLIEKVGAIYSQKYAQGGGIAITDNQIIRAFARGAASGWPGRTASHNEFSIKIEFDKNNIHIRKDFYKDNKFRIFKFELSNGWRWKDKHYGWISRDDIENILDVNYGFLDGIETGFFIYKENHDAIQEAIQQIRNNYENEYKRRFIERHPELRRWREQNPCKEEKPKCLKNIKYLKRIDISQPCYVYFLLKDSNVVYVGQTSSAWPLRILQHYKDETKKFDDVWFIETDKTSLNWIEQKYINEFKPIYNKSNNGVKKSKNED